MIQVIIEVFSQEDEESSVNIVTRPVIESDANEFEREIAHFVIEGAKTIMRDIGTRTLFNGGSIVPIKRIDNGDGEYEED